MTDIIEGFPAVTITYGKSGKPTDSNHATKLQAFATDQQLDELLVISHGWNNSASEAKTLYAGLLNQLRANLGSESGLAARKIGVLAVIWPSKRFNAMEQEDDSMQMGGAASATPVIEAPMDDAMTLAAVLEDELSDADRQRLLDVAKAAIEDATNWPLFLEALKELVPNEPDSGDEADALLLDGVADPQRALEQFDAVIDNSRDEQQAGGAAGSFTGGAAGAVGSVLNYATFYLMKRRAGKVGQHGLAQSLIGIRATKPNLRIHFVGHSFGARVVTMAAHGLNGQSSAAPDSMTLLQAAFSHNSFSASFPPPNKPGLFRNVMAHDCVKGPILITHTFNDVPVRVAYSIASALSGDNASFTNNTPSQYGGLGANGAQHMGGEAVAGELLETDASGYSFAAGTIFNLLSDDFIKGHSKIAVPQVGYAIVKAMATTL